MEFSGPVSYGEELNPEREVSFNLLSPNSNQYKISPCNNKSSSLETFMRIQDIITQNKFLDILATSFHCRCNKHIRTPKVNIICILMLAGIKGITIGLLVIKWFTRSRRISLTYIQNARVKIHGADDKIISVRELRTKWVEVPESLGLP